MKDKDSSVFENYKKLIQEAIEDLKTKGRRHRQIPNILTLMRLTAPCFIIPAAIIGNVPFTIASSIFFGVTDLVDGAIARKFELTSELGEALDAVTDKIFASTLLLAASVSNPILLCNLGLEAIIASINVSKKLNGLPAASSYIGKIKTWFLFCLAGAGIVSSSLNINNILNFLMLTTTAMQVLTVRSYLSSSTGKEDFIDSSENISDTSVVPDTASNESEELQKEKVLETDTVTSVTLGEENESLKQLRAMRNYLESEKEFLSPDDSKKMNPANMEKCKIDDFKID